MSRFDDTQLRDAEAVGSTADLLLALARASIDRVTVEQAYEALCSGGCVIDIRSDSARLLDGIAPGSVHIPRTVLEWRLDPRSEWRNPQLEFDSLTPILICDHGWSSSLAVEGLRHLGHEGACDVIGGFDEWVARGLPVIAPPPLDTSWQLPGMGGPDGDPTALRRQREHWNGALADVPDRYGVGPSEPGQAALAAFTELGAARVLELGSGQGRDTLLFAGGGLKVTAADFAPVALATTREKALAAGLADLVEPVETDVRRPLPFGSSSFDGCFSHMLFCMALTERELESLCSEIRRVVRPGGLCVYTARTVDDPDWGEGRHLGENLFESGGFVVHFFDAALIERLATGFELVEIERFGEGTLPRRLVRVTMRRLLTKGAER